MCKQVDETSKLSGAEAPTRESASTLPVVNGDEGSTPKHTDGFEVEGEQQQDEWSDGQIPWVLFDCDTMSSATIDSVY